MKLLFFIALKQLLDRKRQSMVSLSGIVLGVAFFLAISSLMRGSERDFIRRLIDNTSHITISDQFRNPLPQAAAQLYPKAAVSVSNVQPQTETRGLRGYSKMLTFLRENSGVSASAMVLGQGLISFAGKDFAATINGIVPEELGKVSSIEQHMIDGQIEDLIGYPDGIIVGSELVRNLSLRMGGTVTISSSTGHSRTFKVVGIFRTGRASFDETQIFMDLTRAQVLLNKIYRANSIVVKLDEPYAARDLASRVESRFRYKSVSWQESSEDLMNTLSIRNAIMYTVVSAVLIVAAFGIYNVISTVVTEKYRDIAILKSIGFYVKEIQYIFIFQGIILGVFGCLLGLPLGMLMMKALMQIRFTPPGGSSPIQMPVDWGWVQFLIAASFAFLASLLAAALPARKAGKVQPVDILRGGW